MLLSEMKRTFRGLIPVLSVCMILTAGVLPAGSAGAAVPAGAVSRGKPVLTRLEAADSVARGTEFCPKGKIRSSLKLTKVDVRITGGSGRTLRHVSAYPKDYAFYLKNLRGLHAETLKTGSYVLRITASNRKYKNVKLAAVRFTVKPKSGIAEKLIRTAEAEIGYSTPMRLERTKFERETFGTNGHLWCASFVSWCAKRAGVSKGIIPRSKSTLIMGSRARASYHAWNQNSWGNLERGDVLFFSPRQSALRYRSGGKAVHHVGLVRRIDRKNGVLYTVEGNVSRLRKDGTLDPATRVVRECRHKIITRTGRITESNKGIFWKEFICGYINVEEPGGSRVVGAAAP